MSQLVLNSVIRAIGFTQGGWRHPDATPQRALDLSYYQEYARISERGLFDGLFVANTPAARSNDWTTLFSPLEPVALLSALAPTTTHIGLIATLSSSFNDPYNVARSIATLDHLSGGRAGVNIVTSGSLEAARNFGYDELPDHDLRYERAHEFLEILYQLWDSWDADALIIDKTAGVQSKPGSVRPIGYRGKHFAVHGALDVPRSPQDRPLVFQSGSSAPGRRLAAAYADAVYTAQRTIPDAKAFRDDLHRAQKQLGRSGPLVKVLPGLIPIVASTDAEAHALHDEISALNPPERSVGILEERLKVDLTGVALDEPFPEHRLPPVESLAGERSFHEIVRSHVDAGATLREILRVTDSGNGHLRFVGSVEHVADDIEEWFTAGAVDGFNINPAITPTGLTDFVDHVVPLLQAKGIYKREYSAAGSRQAFA
ncbi:MULTISPECIES: NtaA/DmoA family FMN-dependent monooxygenase [unclassified Mycobacterium]|uniref:NtaA/DmoA family FMN-dependent monooxygenase n=1 Tax=unclassified Mycobacterium TaxID=2642494 RepID=UPI0029C7A468|nr:MULTISPECIES: NtaA/DmoA family FMN-dependent monooxygenase [unclassified Mycobacterium]